jgi:hypothetical protein
MFYLLDQDQTCELKQELKADGIVVFQSATLDLTPSATGTGQLDNTFINLNVGGDKVLHISIRRPENAVVFNARTATGNWGPEERITLQGSFRGPCTTITVYDHGDRYQILFDYHTVHYFNKRIHKNAGVTSVSYGSNPDQTPPFSRTLAMSTYSNMGMMCGQPA